MSPHDSQVPGDDHGVHEPKHKVFLSHSGAQKGFVWQLDEDLRSWDVNPFFDKDRDSLPIGENFPDLIFKAIEECQVGVVILSEEFFTLSHWPMTELVGMVKQRRKIMPIFLGISPADLSNEENLHRWKSQWHNWAKSNERMKLSEWENALRSLKGMNGLVYNHAAGVVAFRKEIVKAVTKIVLPSYEWDDTHVQGRSRLSQALLKKINTRKCHIGVQVVGLYGVGGIGKTTACKYLCKDLYMDFDGRVCHVELGNGSTEKDRVQEVLTKLTDLNKEFFKDKKLNECWSLLKKQMHLKKVFLAIDNVLGRNSIEEAKKYLRLGYCQGCIVMVTTRGRGDLKDLKIDDGDCHEIPELDAIEAELLFLYHAEPKGNVDEQVLLNCINRCYFSKGDVGSFHYHPLALQVLGSELAGEDSNKWKSKLKEVDVFNLRGEEVNGVFSILRRSFDVLSPANKLLFMLVAIFDSAHWYKEMSVKVCLGDHFLEVHDGKRTWYIFEWLGQVCGLRGDDVKMQLEGLKKKSLLEDLGDGTTQIGMHDLWREFAVMETKHGEMEGGCWVYEVVRGEGEDSSLYGGGWKGLQRVCVMGKDYFVNENARSSSVKCLNFSNCSKLTVLKLVDVEVKNQLLDLSALKQLKSLEIVSPYDYYASSNKGGMQVNGIKELANLKVLRWMRIGEEFVSTIEHISSLTNLRILQLKGRGCLKLNLGRLRWLREVRVKIRGIKSILGLSSTMTDLRILDLGGCWGLLSCPGVGEVVGLEVIVLPGCWRLEELPNLQNLTKLRVYDNRSLRKLKAIPDLGSLVSLKELLAGSWSNLSKEIAKVLKETIKSGKCKMGVQVVGLHGTAGIGKTTACKSLCKDLYMDYDGRVCHVELENGSSEKDRVQKVLTKLTDTNKEFLKDKKLDELHVLKEKSLLNDLGDGAMQIGLHDLWLEFAKMKIERGVVEHRLWVYEVVRGEGEDSRLSGGGWKGLQRVCVMGKHYFVNNNASSSSVKCLNFSNCSELTVLKLVDVEVKNQSLDLSALKQLKSLEIVSPNYDDEVVESNKTVLEVSGIGLLTNLVVLIWLGIGVESVSVVEEISCLKQLEVLQLRGIISPILDLHQLTRLQEVRVELRAMESIAGLSSMMTHLRILDLGCCEKLRSCPGVGDVVALEALLLRRCERLEELPNLHKLTKLRVLEIQQCWALKAIPGLGSLVALQELQAGAGAKGFNRGIMNLGELPDISRLSNLEVLDLRECKMLKSIPGLGNLVALRELFAYVQSLPDHGNLTQTLHTVEMDGRSEESIQEDDDSNPQELRFLNLAIWQSVSTLSLYRLDHEVTNLSELTALKSLELISCSLERLPHMGKHMILESLRIVRCKRLRGWDGVGRLGSSESQSGVDLHCDWILPHLQELQWVSSGVVELPDLSHFPRLRKLALHHDGTSASRCWPKYVVPCLANHPQLEILHCAHSPIAELPD